MLERYGRTGVLLIGRDVAYRKTGLHKILFISTVDLPQPPRATVHPPSTSSSLHLRLFIHGLLFIQPPPRATPPATVQPPSPRAPVQPPLHGLLFIHPSIVYCSSSPPWGHPVHPALHTTGSCSSRGKATAHCSSKPPPPAMLTVHPIDRLQLAAVAKESLDRVQLTAIDRSLGFNNARSLQCNRSSSVRAQRLARVQLEPTPRTHACTCTRETRIARPPTSHRNRQLPEIFLPLASTTGFSVMDGPKNVMQLRLRPAQDEKPIFLS